MAFANPLKQALSHAAKIPLSFFHMQHYKNETLEKPVYVDGIIPSVLQYYQDNYGIDYAGYVPATEIFARTPRQLMQYVGTDVLRKINPDWHNQTIKILLGSIPEDTIIFHDLRFPNEILDFVDVHKCTAIMVDNESLVHNNDAHTSEILFNEIEVIVESDPRIDNHLLIHDGKKLSTLEDGVDKIVENILT
jgi:hypothetical protein